MKKATLKITALSLLVALLLAACGGFAGAPSSTPPPSTSSSEASKSSDSNSAPSGFNPFPVGGSKTTYANCTVLEDSGLRDLCLGGAAIEMNDLDKCLTLPDMIRLSCTTGIASKRKDIGICAKLSTSGDRDMCRLGYTAENSGQ